MKIIHSWDSLNLFANLAITIKNNSRNFTITNLKLVVIAGRGSIIHLGLVIGTKINNKK